MIDKKKVIEKRIQEALALLRSIGIPVEGRTRRQQHRMALALFAVAKMKPRTPWSDAVVFGGEEPWTPKSRDIIKFWNEHWGERVSSGSYDDVRRKDLKHLTLSGLVLAAAGKADADPNNPTRGYAINPEAASVLQEFGTETGRVAASKFVEKFGELKTRLEKPREKKGFPITLPDGVVVELSKEGPHNRLQKAIIEEFIPRFVAGPRLLYLGDTSEKVLYVDVDGFVSLGLKEPAREMLPDVVIYDEEHNWVFLIEAVHSANPISAERHMALEAFTRNCPMPKVYVSVFESRETFRKWVTEISWETEVWLAESPGHMIHFNGPKFLGPYENNEKK